MSWGDLLRQAVTKLGLLEKKVALALQPDPQRTRLVPFFINVPISWAPADLSMKLETYVNGGEDVYISGLTATVTMQSEPSTRTEQLLLLNATGYAGGASPGGGGFSWVVPVFDFAWNYAIASTQARYGSAANTQTLVSRESLGNPYKGHFLEFTDPQLLKSGDSITFYAKPLLYLFNTVDNMTGSDGEAPRITVNMIAYGYRSGVIHG